MSFLVLPVAAASWQWFVKTETFVKHKTFPEIRPHLEAHKEWVAALRADGDVITSGYRVDELGKPGGGGLMLFAAADHAAAEALVLKDPLVANGCVDWALNGWIADVGDIALVEGGAWCERQQRNAEAEAEGVAAPLSAVTLESVEPGGEGERVCIDFTCALRDGEGVLAGSCASSLMLVHAETLPTSTYAPPRPFRCNAGPVHAYCLLGDGVSTRYLCELAAGDEVLAVDAATGVGRPLRVGRLKIERRPLLLARWTGADGERAQAFLQDVDTARAVSPSGEAVAATALRAGDDVLAWSPGAGGARHIGNAVEGASAIER